MRSFGLGYGLGLSALCQGRSYSAEATALFARMSVQPDVVRKALIDSQITAGKGYSFWPRLDALWVHAAHDAQAARLNWLSSTYDCVVVNNPTFTVDRGYTPDGSTSYLDTQFNPTTAVSPKYTQNSGTMGIRSNSDNQGAGSLAGFYDGAKGTTINPRGLDNTIVMRVNSGNFDATTPASPTSIGMFTVTRNLASGAGAVKAFRNGAQMMTVSQASLAPANGSFRLGSISNSSYRACQFSMAFVGSGFTNQEALDMYNWFETYRIAVGVT